MQTKLTKITYKDGSITEIISEREQHAIKYNAQNPDEKFNVTNGPFTELLIEQSIREGAKVEETIKLHNVSGLYGKMGKG